MILSFTFWPQRMSNTLQSSSLGCVISSRCSREPGGTPRPRHAKCYTDPNRPEQKTSKRSPVPVHQPTSSRRRYRVMAVYIVSIRQEPRFKIKALMTSYTLYIYVQLTRRHASLYLLQRHNYMRQAFVPKVVTIGDAPFPSLQKIKSPIHIIRVV